MAAFALFLVIAFGLLGWTWLRNQPTRQRGDSLLKLGLVVAVPVLGYLAVTGRLHIVGLILALGYPLLRRFLSGIGSNRTSPGRSGNQSTVTSEILEMTLDHDSGSMHGRVLSGPLEGRSLEDLEESQFIGLLRYCRQQDSDSARLLETYLDKRFGREWRDDDPDAGADDGEAGGESSDSAGSQLSQEEAFEILGLEPGASRDQITQAHRRLMQRLHPDRGGSAYLAARINAARKLLLG